MLMCRPQHNNMTTKQLGWCLLHYIYTARGKRERKCAHRHAPETQTGGRKASSAHKHTQACTSVHKRAFAPIVSFQADSVGTVGMQNSMITRLLQMLAKLS